MFRAAIDPLSGPHEVWGYEIESRRVEFVQIFVPRNELTFRRR